MWGQACAKGLTNLAVAKMHLPWIHDANVSIRLCHLQWQPLNSLLNVLASLALSPQ